jgi:hypothetical protein
MTTATHTPALWRSWHRPLIVLSGAMTVLTVVALVGVFADDRVLVGAPIWLKVLKFSISFVFYGLTLAWLLSLLPTRSRWASIAATVIVAMSFAEMAVIVTQVIRGTTSHFNDSTPLNSLLWSLMGPMIMVLWLSQLVIAVVLIRRNPLIDRTGAYAARLGLLVSLLGMIVAMPMTQPNVLNAPGYTGMHSVGVVDGGPGLPLVGWSTVGGDLRIGHFVGLHALQALPLLALGLTLLARRFRTFADEPTRVRLVVVAAIGYAALVLLLTWQAMRGQSLVHPDALTGAATGGLALALLGAVAAVLSRRHTDRGDRLPIATSRRPAEDRRAEVPGGGTRSER